MRLAGVICGIAAGLVLGFNLAWVVAKGDLPIPAAILIIVSLGLLAWAASRFLAEGVGPTATMPTRPQLWLAVAGWVCCSWRPVAFRSLGGFFQSGLRQLLQR